MWRLGVVIRSHPASRRSGPFDFDYPILVRDKLWFRFRRRAVEREGNRVHHRRVLGTMEGQRETLWFTVCCCGWETGLANGLLALTTWNTESDHDRMRGCRWFVRVFRWTWTYGRYGNTSGLVSSIEQQVSRQPHDPSSRPSDSSLSDTLSSLTDTT